MSRTDMTAEAWDGALFDGTFRRTTKTLPVVSPGSGLWLGDTGEADANDLQRAVYAARDAQRAWAAESYDSRVAVLLRAAQLLEDDPERLAHWLTHEGGSAHAKAAFEISTVISELRAAAALAAHPSGEILRSSRPRLSVARRVPLGIVGIISPFNFPATLSMRSVAPALALGNAVILKPDPRTSVSGGLALAALFKDAGLPVGLLHVLPGAGALGERLVAHPGIACISFTGSTAAGRAIGAITGQLLKKTHLELGGNNVLLVLPDADVAAAASAGAWGSFLHQGQICMTTGRHLVHSSIAEEYLEALAKKAGSLPVGDPADPANLLGPVIDERQRDRVHSLVTASSDAGSRIVAGGSYDGLFYEPTVVAVTDPDTPVWREEVFGPVAPVLIYDSVDEAINILNASEYGLSVGILTADAYAAYELADRIESGAVHVNDQTVDDEATAPFGGVKASGAGGRFGGPTANLDTFTHTQWVTVQAKIERYPI